MPTKLSAAAPPKKRRIKQFPRLEGTAAAQFLRDSGALFHINRTLMHPLGLILLFEEDEAGRLVAVVIDRRDHPDCVFSESEVLEGMRKIKAYMQEAGHRTMATRRRILGYHVQPLAETEG